MTIPPRPELLAVPPAVHGGQAGDGEEHVRVDFSTSVNAFGPAPAVLAAIRGSLDAARVAAYPDPASRAARSALAGLMGVPCGELCVGAGATELILAVVQAFARPGDRVLVPVHGFGEYARAAAIAGASVVTPELGAPDAPLDAMVPTFVQALARHAPRVAFLCTPESPTGRTWPREAVAEVADACSRTGTLLVLDQSFDAFAAAPLGTPALHGHPATLHLRSLTKDHALAGIRLGIAVGALPVVDAVGRARMPWSVSAAAQAAAVALREPDAAAHARRTTALLREEAERVRAALIACGIAARPSDVHYMLVEVGSGSGLARAMLARHGLRVRDCTSFGLPEHIRVAARTPSENDLLIAALRELCGKPVESTARPSPTGYIT